MSGHFSTQKYIKIYGIINIMEKIFIHNRREQKIAILSELTNKAKGLVFVMHGLGGSKEQPIVKLCAKVFSSCNYNVIRFDTTNTFGESDGKYENATATNYYEDLEDVIAWARKQRWFQCPFILVGHSLGGMANGLYAENFPNQVKALIPISTVVSGDLSIKNDPCAMQEWERTGWRISERKSQPGTYKRLPWAHMEDRKKYNLLDKTEKLKMPVLLIVGERDKTTPVEHHKILHEVLPDPKELHIVKGADHVFSQQAYMDKVENILIDWIKCL